MERNFKLKQDDGVGVRVYGDPKYALLGIGESIVYPDGSVGLVIQGVGAEPYVVPQEKVEKGGFYPGAEEGTVWEFPTPRTYDQFTLMAWRSERARIRESKIKKALRRFNLKRLVAKIRDML